MFGLILGFWIFEESQVESYKHQDNSYICHQSFPQLVSEEQEIHGNYGGYHQQDRNQNN